uniref:HMA domain-containing protein n=1 Tax=Leersia perrieri TaxID=77586 RepID=A0A0D9VHM3_9ORYZ
MKKEIIIRIAVKTEKCQKKAMKEAATVSGVQSVTLAGGERNLLLVIGDGVDTTKLTKKLKNKVGSAEIVELRTVDTFEAAAAMFPLGVIHGAAAPGSKDAARAMAARSAPSPYQYNYQPSPYGHLHHPQHHQQWQYASPYAYQQYPYHPSPMMAGGGVGGYGMGSSYSRAVALSHPANYSPLVEKHDYHPMNRPSSVAAAAGGGGAKKSEKPASTGNGNGGGNGGNGASLKAVPRSRRHESDGNGCCIQ